MPLTRKTARSLVPLAAAISVLAGAAPAGASYPINGYFCGSASNPSYIGGYSRCAHSPAHSYGYMNGYPLGTSAPWCVLAKQYSDGSGGNETAPACDYWGGFTEQSGCSSGYSCYGYATIAVQNSVGQYFYGYLGAYS